MASLVSTFVEYWALYDYKIVRSQWNAWKKQVTTQMSLTCTDPTAQAARAIEISGKDANLTEEDKVRPDPPSDWKVDLIDKDKDDPQKLAAHYGTPDEVA